MAREGGTTARVEGDRRAYAEAALAQEVAAVQSARPGLRNSTLNRAAYSLGQLIGAGALDYERTAAQLIAAASQAGLVEAEATPTVRSGLKGGMAEPRAFKDAPVRRSSSAAEHREAALGIWRNAVAPQETSTERYLSARGITIPLPPTIRHAPAMEHPHTGLRFSCMIAAVTGVDRRVRAIHRTYHLGEDGKAWVNAPKLALGPIAGCAVRLAPATDSVALVEGVEDGLALIQLTGAPAWAVLGTSGFLNFEPPAEIRRVVLAPDNDEAGRELVDRAGRRLADMGLTVETAFPPSGKDWNDALLEHAERSAIAEHDGGLTTQDADAFAKLQLLGRAA